MYGDDMRNRQNLHTHTLYCDGKDTMRQMADEAIAHGLTSLGFSSHTYTGFPFDECGIEKGDIDSYFSEIEELGKEYEGRLSLYKGFEYESRMAGSDNPPLDPRLDYSIGSVHLFRIGEDYFAVDNTIEEFNTAMEAAGGIRPLCQNFYDEVVRFATVSDYDITGHFDLITKFTEKAGQTFQNEKWYQSMALEALDAVIDCGKIFEVNTGAISRGYRSAPYPATFLLEQLFRRDTPIILSSDCHARTNITCHFEESEELLRSTGFMEMWMFDGSGFEPFSL